MPFNDCTIDETRYVMPYCAVKGLITLQNWNGCTKERVFHSNSIESSPNTVGLIYHPPIYSKMWNGWMGIGDTHLIIVSE